MQACKRSKALNFEDSNPYSISKIMGFSFYYGTWKFGEVC